MREVEVKVVYLIKPLSSLVRQSHHFHLVKFFQECHLRETISVGICGQFHSLNYGVDEDLETLRPFLLSPEECRLLTQTGVLTIDGQTFGNLSSHFR